MNSWPTPWPDCTVLNENSRCRPRNQSAKPTVMNSPIFTLVTGTPTARALSSSPPTAKIQLPTRVLNSTYVATIVNSSHHNTVMRTETPNMVMDDANTARAGSQPCMSLTLGVATVPEISLVTAILA